MYQALLVMFLFVAICMVVLIVVQQEQGSKITTFLGVGISRNMFSSSYAGNFMTRVTAVLATLFFILSLLLSSQVQVMDNQWDNFLQSDSSSSADAEIPDS